MQHEKAIEDKSREVSVWDPLVRIFHWSLVAFFIIAYLSADDESVLHIYSGYAVLGLISFRVLWGFIGSRHARFSDFITSPRKVIHHLKHMREPGERHLGHNPAGGWMVIALLVTLFVVSLSGLKLYAIEEGKGPLASNAVPTLSVASLNPIKAARADEDERGEGEAHEGGEKAGEEFWEELHEASVNLMILLIILHIGGVIIMSRVHDESLVKAMLTGKKRDNS